VYKVLAVKYSCVYTKYSCVQSTAVYKLTAIAFYPAARAMKFAHQIAAASVFFVTLYMAVVSQLVSNQSEDLTRSGPVSKWPEGRAWPAEHELKLFFASRMTGSLMNAPKNPRYWLLETQFSTFIPCVEETWIFAHPGCGSHWELYRGSCWDSEISFKPQDVGGRELQTPCYHGHFRRVLFDIFLCVVFDVFLLIYMECIQYSLFVSVDAVLPITYVQKLSTTVHLIFEIFVTVVGPGPVCGIPLFILLESFQ
jgi:hypothetical protein